MTDRRNSWQGFDNRDELIFDLFHGTTAQRWLHIAQRPFKLHEVHSLVPGAAWNAGTFTLLRQKRSAAATLATPVAGVTYPVTAAKDLAASVAYTAEEIALATFTAAQPNYFADGDKLGIHFSVAPNTPTDGTILVVSIVYV